MECGINTGQMTRNDTRCDSKVSKEKKKEETGGDAQGRGAAALTGESLPVEFARFRTEKETISKGG